ncbi:MAG: sigma-70 family RNA polymerase sigma factor [Ignavibacteriae bacterium]|nr:sigma-70 family RNA polymerase sigma factor [Ignavibacteria bacterium]MBI3363942.1 sigma-70 family RNA polymerase sigma factor [Ignavibacteriota bacterium]
MDKETNVVDVSDFDVIQRARSGDTSAFVRLYREHAGHLYATCLRMLANAVQAQELAQMSIVKAWQMLASFRGESPFSAWLHRIAVNTVLDHLRAEKRLVERVEFTDAMEDYDVDEGSVPIEEMLDLEAAIASLPVRARTVLVLHDIEGYRHEEIAAMAGIAVGTSKAQLHRARTLLKERLER